MKKTNLAQIAVIVFVLTLLLSMLSACSDGFTTVCSVTLTTNGTTKTFQSTYTPLYAGGGKRISIDEYLKIPSQYHLSSSNFGEQKYYPTSTVPERAKKEVHWETKIPSNEQENYYSCKWYDAAKEYFCYEYQRTGTEFSFIRVKVVNSTTIVIRDKSGETTYTVTSYSIVYFKNLK